MYQPKMKIVHANAIGTGTYVDFMIRPATNQETGGLMVSFVPQKTVGSLTEWKRILPTFDYDKKITVKFTVQEVAQIIQVFEGMSKSLSDGKGLFHRSAKGDTVICLEHRDEPTPGYLFFVSRKTNDGEHQKRSIFLSMTEGFMLSTMFKSGLVFMGFGVPDMWCLSAEPKVEAENKSV